MRRPTTFVVPEARVRDGNNLIAFIGDSLADLRTLFPPWWVHASGARFAATSRWTTDEDVIRLAAVGKRPEWDVRSSISLPGVERAACDAAMIPGLPGAKLVEMPVDHVLIVRGGRRDQVLSALGLTQQAGGA